MQDKGTRAGGCFLTVAILTGLGIGIGSGTPMQGILMGTAAGAALALVTWMLDRRRRD